MRRYRDVGGTSGGLGDFLLGLALLGAGSYLFLDRVVVMSNPFTFLFGHSSFGFFLIPLFLGVALLFWNGGSVAGWVLSIGSGAAILIGLVTQLNVFFKPTSLPVTLSMLGLMAAGLGMVFRALRPHGGGS